MVSLNLDLYDNDENYLCKIDISGDTFVSSSNNITTIIILDTSGSMNKSMEIITHKLLPQLFTELHYELDQPITFITFDDNSKIITHSFHEIKEGIHINAYGGTYMRNALSNLKYFLENLNTNSNIRILTISDGELFDQYETVEFSNEIVKTIQKNNLVVNSQAIRFFTSQCEPDTRGLSSCLQFSNISNPELIDIKADEFKYMNYEKLFNDGFENKSILKCKEDSFKIDLWDNYCKEINLFPGQNIFWLKKEIGDKLIQGGNLLVFENSSLMDDTSIPNELDNGKIFNVQLKEKLSLKNYYQIISSKIDFYFKKLKLMKVLNSKESLEEMDKIVKFYEEFENKLIAKEEVKDLDNSLDSRMILISKKIEKKKLSIANKMRQIKNDENIALLNSQQQADYLRTIDTNDRTSKALAKRAILSGLDFEEIAKKEVIEIANHVHELDDIDEDKLYESFYSRCNTLDGIRLVSKLPENKELFEDINVNDIIKLLNIVGVAAYSPSGNYPDPMTYRLEKIYPGTFISISDILTAYETSHGEYLTVLRKKENEINTCIPYFEDERIHQFLLNYAPHLLEYTSSIGMRKLISEVPYTYEYSILAGYWKMVELLLKEGKSEINIKIFINFIQNYRIVAKSHFEYVIDLVESQKPSLPSTVESIYIANNGITNMTYPLTELILNEKNEIDKDYIQKIVRATYQFEVYQYIRKLIRKQTTEMAPDFIRNCLIELLNIDIEKNKTILNPYFEDDENLAIYEDYIPNIEVSKEKYLKNIFWLDYIATIPVLLKAALNKNNPYEAMKNLPSDLLADDFIKNELGIEYDLDLFKFNCVIQSFLYKDRGDRCDSDNKRMLISDLFYNKHFDKVIKKYVKKVFSEEFQKDKIKKIKNEIEILKNEVVKQSLEAKSIEEFTTVLNKGIKRGTVELTIINSESIGYNDLINHLLEEENNNENVPLRFNKIFALLTGRNENGDVIWNQGNFIRDVDKIKRAKSLFDNNWIEKYEKMRSESGIYLYRGGMDRRNRHGHSNDLPSYWAYGYPSISAMKEAVEPSFMEDYYSKHIKCCGLRPNIKNKKKQEKKMKKMQGLIGGASYSH